MHKHNEKEYETNNNYSKYFVQFKKKHISRDIKSYIYDGLGTMASFASMLGLFCCLWGGCFFFFDAVALHAAAAFEGKALGSIALVSNEESGSDKETDDLMRICKGRKMRILVAHRDSLSGCGAWCKAAGTNSQKSHFLACI